MAEPGVIPPTFRFSGGFPRPYESTTDRLSRPDNVLRRLGVHGRPDVSAAVVSIALARSKLATDLSRLTCKWVRLKLLIMTSHLHASTAPRQPVSEVDL